jgi:hypothetical protein
MFPKLYTGVTVEMGREGIVDRAHSYTIMFKSHQGKQVIKVLVVVLHRQQIPNHASEIDPQSLHFRRYNIHKTRSL